MLCLSFAYVAMFGLAACGGDDDTAGTTTGGGTPASDAGGKSGGTIKTAYTSFPDYLDPALSYTQEGWQSLWTVYTPLLTYKHEEGAEGATVVPGLAEDMPEISADGKTYRLKLRDNLKYSDGTAVKASDFEHAIKRVLNLESGGAPFYEGIVGAEQYIENGRARADIPGIETNDATGDITIELVEPDGRFPYILTMVFASLVPGDTPFQNMTKDPPPGVGPYRFENVRINRGYDLVKVDDFDVPEQQVGNLDRIEVEIIKNRRRQTQDTIQNRIDYMNDPPAPDQLRDVRAQYTDKRYREFVTNSTYYYFLNHRVAPFDKPEVRQAVNYAIDKRSLARLFGGLLEPGCNFLPPGMKGYEKIDPCPYGDPNAAPDVEKARALVKQAGVEGQSVTVYGNDEPELRSMAEYLSDVLNQIGFKAKPRIIEASVYFTAIGNQKTRAQVGATNWFQDFPHPGNFFFLVQGKTIQQTNNQNMGNVDDEEINSILDRANSNPDIDEVADDYAKVDRLLLDGAHVAPFGHRKLTVFYSERMNFEDCTSWHPVYNLDFTQLCLK
ncbi:MAG: ABC transporter substrate-binding protein [Actinomycetota bacterium]|nr:ABC transporter substrate-binding protein [Actinomycetota bacterium]